MAYKPLILAVETSSRIGSVAIAVGQNLLAETSFSGPARHGADLFPVICDLLDRFGLNQQEIKHVYISIGPGSFTGLRIATTLAKMLHIALAVKIVAVDTLDVIAANVIAPSHLDARCSMLGSRRESSIQSFSVVGTTKDEYREIERIAPILDAKRNQFFVAMYRCYPLKKILPDSLMTISQFVEKCKRCDEPILRHSSELALSLSKGCVWLLGDGLLYYKDRFKAEGIRFLNEKYWSPRASKVYELGWQKALSGQFADPLTLIPNYLRPPEVTKPNEMKKTQR